MSGSAWQCVVLVFLAVLGGVIGSFLNVIVYRVPTGQSIIHPGSHCPKCGHPIRWYDNLPVVSWFLLMGRCRDCGGLISWRYPAVETVTMLLFLLLGGWELVHGGSMLPQRPIRIDSAVIFTSLTARESAAVYVYHLMLCCTLLAAALVEYDHPRANRSVWVRLFWPALVWGLLAPMFWPWVHPVPALGPLQEGWISGLVDAGAGLLVGAGAGLVWVGLAKIIGSLKVLSRKGAAPIGPDQALAKIVGSSKVLSPVTPLDPESGVLAEAAHAPALKTETPCSASDLQARKPLQEFLPTSWEAVLGASMLVGLYLGWQAGLGLVVAMGIVWAASQFVLQRIALARHQRREDKPLELLLDSSWQHVIALARHQRREDKPCYWTVPFSGLLGAGALVWILFWKQGLACWQALFY